MRFCAGGEREGCSVEFARQLLLSNWLVYRTRMANIWQLFYMPLEIYMIFNSFITQLPISVLLWLSANVNTCGAWATQIYTK
jgi:hypothetical protein